MRVDQSSASISHTSAWRDLGRIVTAHVIMLRDVGIFGDDVLAALLTAMDGVNRADAPEVDSLGALIAAYDERLDALTPAGAVGAAAVARGRADVIATLLRLTLREGIHDLTGALAETRQALIDLAAAHVTSLMPAHSAGQPAQPTTFGHFLGGIIAPLGRAASRLRAAHDDINRSPLGALALASTSLPIDRERTATLLGFDGPILNTYDAVAATDHVEALAASVAAIAAIHRRFVDELLTWLRTEPGTFRLADTWAEPGADPAMPQLSPPTGLLRIVTTARRIEADAAALVTIAREAPYGPLATSTDTLYSPGRRLFNDAASLTRQLHQLVAHDLEINRAFLANRAGRDQTTSSDLATFLMIEEQLDPAAARDISALTIGRAMDQGVEVSGITPELIDSAALMVIGRELGVEIENISRHLAPRRFIERRTATGAPSPPATRAYLDLERTRLDDDTRWHQESTVRLNAAISELDQAGQNFAEQ